MNAFTGNPISSRGLCTHVPAGLGSGITGTCCRIVIWISFSSASRFASSTSWCAWSIIASTFPATSPKCEKFMLCVGLPTIEREL